MVGFNGVYIHISRICFLDDENFYMGLNADPVVTTHFPYASSKGQIRIFVGSSISLCSRLSDIIRGFLYKYSAQRFDHHARIGV